MMLRLLALLGLPIVLVAALVATSSGDAQPSFDGTVYIESNGHTAGSNSVLAFRYSAGSLRPLEISEYPTGGGGPPHPSHPGAPAPGPQIGAEPPPPPPFPGDAGGGS